MIFPWGPACALLNNLVELRADTYRMVRVSTRPVPRQVGGIGTWRAVMGFVVSMSVFVNMGIYILPLRGLYVRSLATSAFSSSTYSRILVSTHPSSCCTTPGTSG